MIVLDVRPQGAAEVAATLGTRRAPCWLVSPGDDELAIAREVVASDPVRIVRGNGQAAVDALAAAWEETRDAWGDAPDVPVAIGALSYDLGRTFERLRGRAFDPSVSPNFGQLAPWPAVDFRFYDALWVRDVRRDTAQIWAVDDAAAGRLEKRLAASPSLLSFHLDPLVPLDPPAQHLAAIERALAYVRAGDIYQVNLARRLRAGLQAEGPTGLAVFSQLQTVAPAPHALWLGDCAGGQALVGNSPERFLKVTRDRMIATAPIKGTRPRGVGADDQTLAAALVGHQKDRAEHVMIVDLERNDLGRLCEVGSVEVVDPLRVLSLPHVHHLVTTVRGKLRADVGLPDILRATFPGGSITGAPKIRAMEIIDELEPAARGPYCGATGWLGAGGDLDLAIAIRTAVVDQDGLTLWVGGGIVADSQATDELAETTVKAGAFAGLSASGVKRSS